MDYNRHLRGHTSDLNSDSESSPEKAPRNTREVFKGRGNIHPENVPEGPRKIITETKKSNRCGTGKIFPESPSPMTVNFDETIPSDEEADESNQSETERKTTKDGRKTPFENNRAQEDKQPGLGKWCTTALTGLVIIIAIWLCLGSSTGKPAAVFEANCSEFLELKKSFPNQDRKLFNSLKVGIERTANGQPPQPTVFSLFSTDQEFIDKFMSKIIAVTKKCIDQKNDHISLNKDQLNDQMVENYKQELTNQQIMVISNVDEADPHSVPVLHTFCDTENPLVHKSIIFFTIKVPTSPTGKPIDYITEYLNNRWDILKENIRVPLITRMLDQTFFLKP